MQAGVLYMSETRDCTVERKKLDSLTSLRAVAAVLVVVQHTVGYDVLSTIPIVNRFPWDHGVSFFFVLSGFILTYVYQELKPERWREFFVARIARIWPAHVFALLMGFLLGQYALGNKPTLLINAAMLQSWIPVSSAYFSYNGVSWSISTELGFYLMFPFLILGFSRSWHWKLAIVMAVLGVVLASCVFAGLPGYSDNSHILSYHGLVYISPLARLLEFFIGMLTGQLFFSRPMKSSSTCLWSALEIVVPAIAVANSLWGIQLMMTPWAAVNEYLMHSGSQLWLALVIFIYAHHNGIFSRLLCKPAFIFLGEISFSVYLLHIMIYWSIVRTFPAWDGVTRHMVFWPSLLVAASGSYLFVEQPARKFLRKAFSRTEHTTSRSLGASVLRYPVRAVLKATNKSPQH